LATRRAGSESGCGVSPCIPGAPVPKAMPKPMLFLNDFCRVDEQLSDISLVEETTSDIA
jgi:hypothetical protein